MAKMYKRGPYNYGTGDDMINHIEELVAERDALAARLAEAEREVAAFESMHQQMQKQGGPNVLRRQLELRRYMVRAETAERQRDAAMTPAAAARLLAHAIAEDGDVMRVMINAVMPHLHADMTADCWNTVTEVRRAVIAGCDAVAEGET